MSMFQLKNLYNGARVPVTGDKDQLKNHFVTGMNMIIRDHTLSMTAFLAFLTPSPSDRKITSLLLNNMKLLLRTVTTVCQSPR